MTDSPATPSAKGDPQGPSIHVDSGTPSSTGPPAVSAPAAPGEPAPGAALLSTGAGAPSALSTAVATAADSTHHPSPESQSSSDAGSLSRSGTSTEHNVSHMGGGFPSPSGNVLPPHGKKRPCPEADDAFIRELDGMRAPGPAGPSSEHEATVPEPSDGQNRAKRTKRMNGTSGGDDDDDDCGDDGDDDIYDE